MRVFLLKRALLVIKKESTRSLHRRCNGDVSILVRYLFGICSVLVRYLSGNIPNRYHTDNAPEPEKYRTTIEATPCLHYDKVGSTHINTPVFQNNSRTRTNPHHCFSGEQI